MMNNSMENGIQVHDIYDVWYEPFWHQTWFILFVSSIFLVIAYVCARWVYRKYSNKTYEITPEQRMRSQLTDMRTRAVSNIIDPKELYYELTQAFKVYLGCVYSLELVDKTDYELLDSLKKTQFPSEELHELKRVLDMAVLVKFAQYDSSKDALIQDIDWCQKQVGLLSKFSQKDGTPS